MSDAIFAAWFDESRNTSDLTSASVVIGGGHLLREFLTRVTAVNSDAELLIVSPFIDESLLERIGFAEFAPIGRLDLTLITTPSFAKSGAARALASLPWRKCRVLALKDLHAKLFVLLTGNGERLGLLGSHNFTYPAAFTNFETGVLLTGSDSAATEILNAVIDHIHTLATKSSVAYDSLAWPRAFATPSA